MIYLVAMNKNIIITGVSRTGKSTLSRLLAEQLAAKDYVLIPLDPYIDECKMKKDNSVSTNPRVWKDLEFSTQAQDLAIKLIKDKSSNQKKNIIFECAHPSYDIERFVRKLSNNDDFIILCLSHGKDITGEMIFDSVKLNDTPNDWSFHEPDANLRFKLSQAAIIDRVLEGKCRAVNVPYVVTSHHKDRHAFLSDLAVSFSTELVQ